MTTRAILQFQGSLKQGLHITLNIRDSQGAELTEAKGQLPPAPELAESLSQWQQSYRQTTGSSRIMVEQITVEMGALAQKETCSQLGQQLQAQFCSWLNDPGFRPIDQRLRETLNPQDSAELLLRSEDQHLHRLPWHLWDFVERFSQTEVIFGSPPEQLPPRQPPSGKVRVLLILGDRRNIDTDVDRQLLEQLPQAEVVTLVEPSRKQIDHHLWSEQSWDILCFAGHSHTEGTSGCLGINSTESLSLEELRYALRHAITQGLQLALFNSCDGLGLAYALEQLHIPQLIAMREPVPDSVAQAFIEYFLAAFSQGKSLHLALRQARERLQVLEKDFPWATWLPVLFQNPAVQAPTWSSLHGNLSTGGHRNQDSSPTSVSLSQTLAPSSTQPTAQPLQSPPATALETAGTTNTAHREVQTTNSDTSNRTVANGAGKQFRFRLPTNWSQRLGIGFAMSLAVLGLRQANSLQRFELALFDQLLRSRPSEPEDSRILVVGITEENRRTAQDPHGRSLSDPTLLSLLTRLDSLEPAAIGLDLYREEPIELPMLQQQFQQPNHPIIGVCKNQDRDSTIPGFAPPPGLDPSTNVGFSDVPKSIDGIARIQVLAADPVPSSPCQAAWSLSAALTYEYLSAKGLEPKFTNNGNTWAWGKAKLRRIGAPWLGNSQPSYAHYGPFGRQLVQGHQLMLNYRIHQPASSNSSQQLQDPTQAFHHVTVDEVLAGKLDKAAVQGKIVLIGVIASDSSDRWLTPFRTVEGRALEIPGVYLQAQMISQLLSAIEDQRLLLRCLPWLLEGVIILAIGTTAALFLQTQRPAITVAVLLTLSGLWYATSLGVMMLTGIYLPILPSLLALLGGGSSSLALPSVQKPKRQKMQPQLLNSN